MNTFFRKARADETDTILSLYRSVIGTPFCTWNDEYPGLWEITHDLETGNLFVLETEGRLVGSISIVPENELDGLNGWSSLSNAGEFARVVVHPAFQGRHLARLLVSRVLEEMKERGFKSVHIAVVKENTPALKTYLNLGFRLVGEAAMWGHAFHLCELPL